jgi:hypothetical protein
MSRDPRTESNVKFTCVLFRGADTVSNYLKLQGKVLINGTLEITTNQMFNIHVDKLELLGGGQQNQGNAQGSNNQQWGNNNPQGGGNNQQWGNNQQARPQGNNSQIDPFAHL